MKLDPRTKLFLTIAGNSIILSAPVIYGAMIVVLPAVLLVLEKRWRFSLLFSFLYAISAFSFDYLKTMDVGLAGTLFVSTMMLVSHVMPISVIFYYVMTTTKVNEFMAGMSRMHTPNKVTIPLAVMIRFFPTVFDEARDIGNAMHMRGIRLFSLRTLKNPFLFLEYRLIPLLVSLTKIGDELSLAATTRGLSPETRRSCMVEIGFRVQDVIVFVYCISVIVIFLLRN
ncbi:MAG: energy-coupling factor transporter transmembrane component T [Fibrobacter sp.]|nr:energy-coupling factor transporter transmembrane component T [Fibrobacter sp.]